MSRILIVARGEHHDDFIWYPEVFDAREDIDGQSFFEGLLAGICSIWGEFSEAFVYHQGKYYNSGGIYKGDFIQWRPRSDTGEGAWLSCSAENLCAMLLDQASRGNMNAAIEVKPA